MTSGGGGVPVPAVLAVVVHECKILLVQRANPPDAGCWGFPGGHVEWGERLFAAAERELREETGVEARADEVLTALDVLSGGAGECVAHHFVLVAVRCIWRSGSARPADDVLAVDWFTLEQVAALGDAASADVFALAETALNRHLEKA